MIKDKVNVLVTGSGGVTGKAVKRICHKYVNKNFIFIKSSDLDLRDFKKTLDFFKENQIEEVINLAAVSGGIGISLKHQASMLRDNVLINLSIVEACVRCNVNKLVLCLTTGMYPENAKLPLTEDNIHNGEPSLTNYGSSFAKRLIEPVIRSYREEYDLNVVGLIPSGIYGPEDNFHPMHAPMLPAIINRAYEAKKNNSDLEIWGTGKPLREYTFSEDIAEIFIWALDHFDSEKPINIGNPEELSIKNIVYLICKKIGIDKSKIFFNTNKPDGIFKKTSSNKNFQILNNFNYIPMEQGINKTIDWFLKVKDNNEVFLENSKIKEFNIYDR
jgi:GDP-L-fucose synthase|tara:strand:+ start:399 stop:1388 length:990 start_codon:yes stop_codon:yes gene_type:complete